MTFKKSFLFTLLAILLTTVSFFSGYFVRAHQDETLSKFPILAEAYEILASQGLKEIPQTPALEYGMIHGMVQAYDDPYTLFIEPVQHELESDTLQGSFGGIGVRLGNDSDGFFVLFPFPDSPASAAGVLDGDRLLAVGDLRIEANTPVDTVQSAIRGPVGMKVTLTIARKPDYSPFEVSIKRAEIPLPSVTWHLDPDEPSLGVLDVNIIAATTAAEIQRAFEDLQARNATHFVLDLRDDPGGLLTAGVDVARLFLKSGVVIQQQYRGKDVETYKVERVGPLADVPLAVLINHGSASAAEIIAGALQVHRRAILVGSPSFGKDTVQLVYDLHDGSSLHVTAAHWWIPDLQPTLGGNGLQPDILVTPEVQASGSGADPVLKAAMDALLKSR